ncbi:hypothetical protein Ae706Ps2_6616c [Pseudonocardia sp. Ae706_Ps2]|nr:hypothetical protein Ae706Ps2_6599c [Pseudonocardia sp. Ae706_Ps2]OLM08850.1 hypothetical protein Ae706Ps2_6607c [Pseudonocardia sp. Ae706_Ps2]OLM08852.1 hypothetical protein Ae706Ps2_6609c [Pseudonocardia sp. Ae706_Ps2]OLM08859.1 hypothetical protein Ae706Ps2_6616c [Pseudonocardia sp. Ae706_Ps2]
MGASVLHLTRQFTQTGKPPHRDTTHGTTKIKPTNAHSQITTPRPLHHAPHQPHTSLFFCPPLFF